MYRRFAVAAVIAACAALALTVAGQQTPKIKVHLVSHTHDDTGWLKTVDQYYLGMNNSIYFAGVQYILDSVIASLLENPARKFTYVEMAYLARWWDEQNDAKKAQVRQLVRSGQLQFANGGWCMHDEANPHYIDMIDQTTLGHQFLKNAVGAIPKVGWQIDPFGHSATNAALLSAKVGFEAIYFGRADYTDYTYREETLSREFIWQASPSMPDATLLGGILLTNHYGPPKRFNWDVLYPLHEPIQDDPNLDGYNVNRKVQEFVDQAARWAGITRGSHQLWTMGDDFRYQDAHMWYKNIDKLIKYVNEDGRVEASYSTPYEYTQAKLSEPNVTFPRLTGDFFPYRDSEHAFWTGYFTSRPALKRYIRTTSGYYSVSRQIQALAGMYDATVNRSYLAEALALTQHHDSVTGTAKQHVAFDYARRLHNGSVYDSGLLNRALQWAFVDEPGTLVVCWRSNQSECAPTGPSNNASSFTLFIWNAMPYARDISVELPVANPDGWQIQGTNVSFTAYPSPRPVTNYGFVNPDWSAWTYGIVAAGVPALGFVQVSFTPFSPPEQQQTNQRETLADAFQTYAFSNAHVAFRVSGDPSKWITSLEDLKTQTTVAVKQDWCYYASNPGDLVSSQPSGAYIFRPVTNSTCEHPCPDFTNASITFISNTTTNIVVERVVCPWISERLVLSAADVTLRHQFTVGPISDDYNMQGREVVTRILTDVPTGDTFYTDSNGREMQKRVLNYRATWPFVQSEPIAGNYYPINTAALLNGTDGRAFAVTVDSSVGGASLNSGEVELMVHRRLMQDDMRGVGEPLNETQHIWPYVECGYSCGSHYGAPLIIRGEHRWMTAPSTRIARSYRKAIDETYFQAPPLLVVPVAGSAPASRTNPRPTDTRGSAPGEALVPSNVQVITLQRTTGVNLLLRLGHKYAINEDLSLSQPVYLNLCSFLAKVLSTSNFTVQEKSLTTTTDIGSSFAPSSGGCTVMFGPLDVRTFEIVEGQQ